MSGTLAEFNQLTDAEQYFEFFDLPFDRTIVNVNRLHILKKFSQSIREINAQPSGLTETEKLDEYRNALQRSYSVFLTSNALEQKLFKVFHDKPKNVVMLGEIGSN